MNENLEQSFNGYRQIEEKTIKNLDCSREFSFAPRCGAVTINELPDVINKLLHYNRLHRLHGDIKLVRTEELPFPDELRAYVEEKHPGQSQEYLDGTNTKETCECPMDIRRYKRSYLIFKSEESGNS